MERKKRGYSKHEYQKFIWQYEKRRETYNKILRQTTVKMKGWKQRIKEIDIRESKLKAARDGVNNYFEVEIQSQCRDAKHEIARKVFYKYGIEELHFFGTWLTDYIGYMGAHTATKSRMAFTRSFKEDPKSREVYYKVRDYLLLNAA